MWLKETHRMAGHLIWVTSASSSETSPHTWACLGTGQTVPGNPHSFSLERQDFLEPCNMGHRVSFLSMIGSNQLGFARAASISQPGELYISTKRPEYVSDMILRQA